MDSYSEIVNQPIKIGGKKVILVQDVLTSDPLELGEGTALIVEANASRPDIYVQETNIRNIKARFPKVPIYGLWHVLLHSGVIRQDIEVQVLPENPMDGVFIRVDTESGRPVLTGEYTDGIFQNAGDLLLTDAQPLQFNLKQLKLPTERAMLVEELSAIRDRRRNRMIVATLVLFIFAFVVAGLIDLGLNLSHQAKMNRYQEKQSKRVSLQTEVKKLQKTRIESKPNDEVFLNRLYTVALLDPEISIKNQSLTDEYLKITLSKELKSDPKQVFPWLETGRLANGDWQVSVPLRTNEGAQ